MKLNEELRKIRRQKNITQSQLAKTVGVSGSLICKIEKNITAGSIKNLEKIAKGLGAKIEISLREVN
ncbi:helix-turn-helix transcriptional regulator [Phascolarctobacterium sp.]|uniref:helix-turn-helix transcriptional regulator n=1 Tax=Phascolarctobacterium sp. TaxID=2049039 RepID=UPI0013224C22|nr:helix-turn-helix transcriptional regulator [Phascolarctobacterium sp.]MUU08127.1 XRE family transcriptional regulator [Phascolarctobacterium sp.]MUU17770.1 XRE family transcriptional regulator [Phascolarctobacterium sp.]